MTKTHLAIFLFVVFLFVFIAACSGGNPIAGGEPADPAAPPILNLNTGGVGMDGVMVDPDQYGCDVAPGSAHVVHFEPSLDFADSVFEAQCSGGSWRVDGEDIGYTVETDERYIEWVAPQAGGPVQFVFRPVSDGRYQGPALGMMINVSDEWYMNPREPIPYDREAAYANPMTGETVAAASGELLVKLADGEALTEVFKLRSSPDYRVLERLSGAVAIFRLKFDPSVDLASAWNELAADPRIDVVEPNYLAYPALVPDDPEYGKKHEFPKIDAPLAWDIETGSHDVVVAVIDTGADRDHPDLAGNVLPGADFIVGGDGLGGETPGDGMDNNQDGMPDQNVGHGSHVAGIIAAQAFNGEGACGIAYNVSILPLRVFPTNGDTGATFSSIIDAISYAAAEDDVRIINMSIGTTYESSLLQSAINSAWNAGKVLVAAAANSNTNQPFYPGAHDNVLAVAAINKSGEKASFSNYGTWVDVSAYGTGIYSTCFDDAYAYMSGTSMACPLVSGCVALLFSHDPDLTNDLAVSVITAFVDDVYELNPDYAGELGSGIVNPYLALSGLDYSQPGDMDDGDSEGSYSDTGLEPGPGIQL